jgi:hypothetical protein
VIFNLCATQENIEMFSRENRSPIEYFLEYLRTKNPIGLLNL